jgi:hypothetical protein
MRAGKAGPDVLWGLNVLSLKPAWSTGWLFLLILRGFF